MFYHCSVSFVFHSINNITSGVFFNRLSAISSLYIFKRTVFLTSLYLMSMNSIAIEPIPAKVSFKCNVHTINKTEGQTKCEPLDDEYGGYCLILKSKHQKEQVGHMGLLLLRDSFTGNYWAYDLMCPTCINGQYTWRPRLWHAEWQNIHMGSSGQTNQQGRFSLITYQTELEGDVLYISNYF